MAEAPTDDRLRTLQIRRYRLSAESEVAAGYETDIRIAEAVTPSHYHYWHTTGTGGTLAAAKIHALDIGEIINALSNAGFQAAGLW